VNATLFTVRIAQPQDAAAIVQLEQQCVQESEGFRGSAQLLSTAPLIGNDLEHVLTLLSSCRPAKFVGTHKWNS